MNIYLVYRTDNWHSYASRDIIGVCTDMENAVSVCKQQAKKEGKKLKGWNLEFLQEKLQTQGYKGEGEFQIEELETDKLL